MAQEDLAWAIAELRSSERLKQFTLYRDYYEGRHRLLFATQKFRNIFGAVFKSDERFRELDFSDNICGTVVDVMVERLRVNGFGDPAVAETEEAKRSREIWERNRMRSRANEVHRDSFVTGNGYAIVWPGADGKAVIWPQRAEQIAVEYSEELPGELLRAAKLWRAGDRRWRLTLYLPDRIEKFVSREKKADDPGDSARRLTFKPIDPELFGSEQVVDNPYGRVPVFHFPNKRNDGPGVSEIHDVIPLQDALTKSQIDLLVAMEFSSFRQRWATGLEIEVDEETGQPIGGEAQLGQDRLLTAPEKEARFGSFEASDLDQIVNVVESFRSEIARVSGTPLHVLFITRGDFPSGEAMKSAEIRFTEKLGDRQDGLGANWQDAMSFARRIDRKNAKASPPALWKPATARSEKEQLEVLLMKKALGVPRRQLIREAGYPDEIADQAEAELDAQADEEGEVSIPTDTGRLVVPARVGEPQS